MHFVLVVLPPLEAQLHAHLLPRVVGASLWAAAAAATAGAGGVPRQMQLAGRRRGRRGHGFARHGARRQTAGVVRQRRRPNLHPRPHVRRWGVAGQLAAPRG